MPTCLSFELEKLSASSVHHVEVTEEFTGTRLDRFLTTLDFISSRSRGVELIEQGLVTLAGKTLKASFRLRAGQNLQICLPPPGVSTLQPLDAPLDTVFEDDDLIVVNKPSGLVVHPAAGHAQDTLVNILLHRVGRLSLGFAENRPGIVHRLDRDTSGILVVAKNDLAHHALAEQFRQKTAHRLYWAIVDGVPKQKTATLKSHLARHPTDRKRFASSPGGQGKLAITHYRVLKTAANGMTWIECKLETGRTHQIRVHLSEQGLPIVGDPVYGGRAGAKYPRLALHACELGFTHPRSRKQMRFKADWPADLRDLTKKWGFHDV